MKRLSHDHNEASGRTMWRHANVWGHLEVGEDDVVRFVAEFSDPELVPIADQDAT